MDETRVVLKSFLLHLQAALTAAGWSDVTDWVIEGHVEPVSKPPVVAVVCSEQHYTTFEMGSTNKQGRFFFDMEIAARTRGQLSDLINQVSKNTSGVPIINFNTAMPGDIGYDATAQTIASADTELVKSTVKDYQGLTARVFFILMPNQPIVL